VGKRISWYSHFRRANLACDEDASSLCISDPTPIPVHVAN
jgi:hypothetical protein